MKSKAPKLRIKKNVPIPMARTQAGYAAQLRALAPNECAVFPLTDKQTTVRKRASQALGSGNYAVRLMKDGIYVWKIKSRNS